MLFSDTTFTLTNGTDQMKPSDLATVLCYDSGSSSYSMAKISHINTPLFLCNIQFYFPCTSLLFSNAC
jgi:hypothetical protein